jgi:hypothetical protein
VKGEDGDPRVAWRTWRRVPSVDLAILCFTVYAMIFALSDSVESAKITPELTAAFNDRSVLTARRYEWAVIAAIIVLMVAKPF